MLHVSFCCSSNDSSSSEVCVCVCVSAFNNFMSAPHSMPNATSIFHFFFQAKRRAAATATTATSASPDSNNNDKKLFHYRAVTISQRLRDSDAFLEPLFDFGFGFEPQPQPQPSLVLGQRVSLRSSSRCSRVLAMLYNMTRSTLGHE